MKTVITILVLIAVQEAEKDVVRKCQNSFCATVSIQGDTVRFRESQSFVRPYDIGRYVEGAQKWVPPDEAPIRELTTSNSRRVIVSATLGQYDPEGPLLRLRVFDPRGESQLTYDGNHFLDDIEAGKLFGTSDVVLSIQTGGASASIQDTDIWILPDAGKPQHILHVKGALRRFQPSGSGVNGLPGVWVEQQTYDGVHASTKGYKVEFWAWSEQRKILALAPEGNRQQ